MARVNQEIVRAAMNKPKPLPDDGKKKGGGFLDDLEVF
jgi:hypothetical protein